MLQTGFEPTTSGQRLSALVYTITKVDRSKQSRRICGMQTITGTLLCVKML